MSEIYNYEDAVKTIKTAILQSQYDAARSVNEKQLLLYYGIGKYISLNSRKGFWGKSAIDTISERLEKELPGLRGFSARNLRYMRTFYEEWEMLDNADSGQTSIEDSDLAHTCAKMPDGETKEIWNTLVPNRQSFPMEAFLSIGFSHHRLILSKVKDVEARIYYIKNVRLNATATRNLEKA